MIEGAISTEVYRSSETVKSALETPTVFRIMYGSSCSLHLLGILKIYRSVYSKTTAHPLQITPGLFDYIFQKYSVSRDFLNVVASFGSEPNLAESSNSNVSVVESDAGRDCCMFKMTVELDLQYLSISRYFVPSQLCRGA